MDIKLYSLWMILISVGGFYWFTETRNTFNEEKTLAKKISVLEEKIEEKNLEKSIISYRFKKFHQEVAQTLDYNDTNQRGLASVLQKKSFLPFEIEEASSLLEAGKSFISKNKYLEASVQFEKLIKWHPLSTHIVEAFFLLTESYFQLKEFEKCLLISEKMMLQFPEDDLTGYSLLRLGQVYLIFDRIEDAENVFKTVLRNYSNQEIGKQARILIDQLKL